jgi:hypothetical protein
MGMQGPLTAQALVRHHLGRAVVSSSRITDTVRGGLLMTMLLNGTMIMMSHQIPTTLFNNMTIEAVLSTLKQKGSTETLFVPIMKLC